jgi:hypothetical protein
MGGPPKPTQNQIFASGVADVRDHRILQGQNPDVVGQTIDEMFPTLGPAAQKKEATTAALRRLQNVATGRNFLADKVLPVAGGVSGWLHGDGVMGAVEAGLGLSTASHMPKLIDAAGELGQSLALGSRDAIKASALKMANDPFKLQRLADAPGAVGNAARWALEKANDPAAFAARSYVLTMQPSFRKMLAGADVDDQQ